MTDLRTYHYYALHEADSQRPGRWAVTVVSPESGEALGTVTSELPVRGGLGRGFLCADSRGTHLYVGLNDGIHLLETQTLTEVRTEASKSGRLLDEPVWDAVIDHQRERLYVAVGRGGVVEIDTTTNTVLRRLETSGRYAGVAVSPDGTRLYTGSSEGAPMLKVLDLADGTLTATVELAGFAYGPAGVRVALNEDGSLFYTLNSYREDSLTVVDTATLTVAARGSGHTEAVWPGGDGQRVHAVVRGDKGHEGAVLAARTLERLGDFPLAPEGNRSAPMINAMTGGPDGALCLATFRGFVIATPAGDGRWEHQRVETKGFKCRAVVAAAPTRYRAPAPERPARTVGVIKKSAPGYFHRPESGQMVENAYSANFQPGERLPETTEVVQGYYKRGDRVTYIWYPMPGFAGSYKYFYYVPFWGVYIDGDDITWDDAASAAIPRQAGLVARHSGKLVEIPDGTEGLADGARAQQWERRDADNQRFTLEAVEDGYYRITSRHSGKVLEVTDAETDNGTAVRQGEWSGGTHQQWRPEPVGDGWYRLVARHSGRVLQIAGGTDGARNGAPVRQQEWANADHQKFRLDPLI
ncbi:RICIN domain-containing protein [Streptomyces olivoreticuli]|uniref:RICIN domain-containing protein n=1 Tax=Streptomyces olivoreticuli TaxID=68246 RepID=UPI000E248829|nr:RICIN domain-containing protein [Streptomyces olivoreticuli]